MRTIVEPLEGNKVKLSVEVDEAEFERSIDAAFRKIAQEVRIPGFRPGKAPRRVLEARFGAGTGRAEALRESLPDYYAQALRDNDVDAIAAPEIDITAGEESGPVSFDAVVEVRPRITLVGYGGLRVVVPNPEVSEEDVAAQLDRMRANFGELSPVERPASTGDNVTINMSATRGGEPVASMTTDDFLYELGSGTVLPELDEHLQGARPGDILAFSAELPDGAVQLRVLVKDIKEKVLPEMTDEWAQEASEFDTVDELRADVVERLGAVRRLQAALALRNGAVEALVGLVDVDVPEPLVQSEIERRAHELGHRLEHQGTSLAQYLRATGQTEEQVVAGLREEAVPAVKADLALRAMADAEGLEATDEDLEAELVRLAEAYRTTPAELRSTLERAGQVTAVRSDLKKSRALDWLVEHVELVDPEGRPVDRALLAPGGEAATPDAAAPDTTAATPDTTAPDTTAAGPDAEEPTTASPAEQATAAPQSGEP